MIKHQLRIKIIRWFNYSFPRIEIFFLSSGQPAHTAEVSANSNANGEATSNKDAKAHVTDSLIALNGPKGLEGPQGPEGVEKLG